MSWTRDLRKLGARSWSERALLLEAFIWLGVMRAAIGRMPFHRIAARLGLAPGENHAALDGASVACARRIGWAVQAMAAHAPWQSACLVQALAGMVMLRRRKIPGTLYLGVAKDALVPEHLAAHAWLLCGDLVLTGESGRERFGVVARFAG